jgi:two-component system, OmpR family, phosphate regulon sensor histidine kinase PhoR
LPKRSIIFYWLLLLIPSLVIGAAAFRLLWKEQERMDQAFRSSVQDRVRAIAQTLQITIEGVEDDLSETLLSIPNDKMVEDLTAGEKQNPLIRNVFVWKPRIGLLYPVPGSSATREERRFMERYHGIFSGRISWASATADSGTPETPSQLTETPPVGPAGQMQGQQKTPSLVKEIRKLRYLRQELQIPLQSEKKGKKGGYAQQQRDEFENRGWIPWFAENRLHILGWVQRRPGSMTWGLELELMALLSRLVSEFPKTAPDGTVIALVDGQGRVWHQTGSAELDPRVKPDLTASLAPHLPHWHVVAYFVGSGEAGTAGQGFLILGSLLLATFIVAIILGGSLLSWQAHRNMVDARQKTSFVSGVSHELKTPLTSIRMYAELLSEDRIKDPEKRKHYLQVIVAESQRLARLVNNVLHFSRLEQGREKYHREEIDLAAFVAEILDAHNLRIQQAGLDLKIGILPEDMVVSLDRDAMEQVLLNIVDNAIKYAADGGELVVDLRRTNGACELKIMDRGPGIPSAHQKSIFEKFHRVDDSLTARQPGSGLGLSIARQMLRDLGGDLIFEPREGGGSSFIVRVPLDDPST